MAIKLLFFALCFFMAESYAGFIVAVQPGDFLLNHRGKVMAISPISEGLFMVHGQEGLKAGVICHNRDLASQRKLILSSLRLRFNEIDDEDVFGEIADSLISQFQKQMNLNGSVYLTIKTERIEEIAKGKMDTSAQLSLVQELGA